MNDVKLFTDIVSAKIALAQVGQGRIAVLHRATPDQKGFDRLWYIEVYRDGRLTYLRTDGTVR